MFAFYLANEDKQSFVQIGDYTTEYLKDEKSMIWLKTEPGYFWSTKINGFRIGNQGGGSIFNKPKAFTTNTFPAIFDTATSLIYLPQCKLVNFRR